MSELEWLRQQIWIALTAPHRFARSLTSEHFGLGGPIVAIAAGASLSLALDIFVLSSRGFEPLAFLPRLLTDAFFLALRLAIMAVILSALAYAALRLVRRPEPGLDALVTASSFALAPLVLAFPVAVPAVLEPLLAPVCAVLVLVLAARALYGLGANFVAVLSRPFAALALLVILAVGAFALADEIWRARYVAYAFAPALAPELSAAPAAGRTIAELGTSLTAPERWHDAAPRTGELLRIETDIDGIAVRRTRTAALLTAGEAADDLARIETFALFDYSSRREIVRIGGVVAVDDRYVAVLSGKRIVIRQFTILRGAEAYALALRSIDPPDVEATFAEAASIAKTWRIPGEP